MLITPEMLEQSRLRGVEEGLLRAQWHAAGSEHLPYGLGWATWLEPYTFHLIFATLVAAGFWAFWQLSHVLKRTAQICFAERAAGSALTALSAILLVAVFLPDASVPAALAVLCIMSIGVVLLTWRKTPLRSRISAAMSAALLVVLWGAQDIGLEALSHEQLGKLSEATLQRIKKEAASVKEMTLEDYRASRGWL